MVPLEILPMVPLVANGTIGSQWYHWCQCYHWWKPFTNGTIGSPNGTIGKPNGVKSNIMINTSNLFLYS